MKSLLLSGKRIDIAGDTEDVPAMRALQKDLGIEVRLRKWY